MINARETGCLPGENSFGRETGFVKPGTGFVQEASLGRETGFVPKTNEVAAGIKQIFAE